MRRDSIDRGCSRLMSSSFRPISVIKYRIRMFVKEVGDGSMNGWMHALCVVVRINSFFAGELKVVKLGRAVLGLYST